MAPLFKIPIATGGSFECTSPSPQIYVLSFESPPDNRLTTAFCQAFLLALDIIEHKHPSGVVITTSKIAKFYSNGLDLDHANATEGFFEKSLYAVFKRLLTYPMPTVALINGHAFAGGFMMAMHHDYRVQNPSKGFLCLNELDFGAVVQPAMVAIFRDKLPYPSTFRDMLLEAKRFTAPEALKEGIVDALGGMEEALALIKSRSLVKMGASGVYGGLKEEIYRHTLGWLQSGDEGAQLRKRIEDDKQHEKEVAAARVRSWETPNSLSKL